MRPQLLMFCFAVCIVGTLYSLIDSGVWFGSTQTSFINAVAGINAVKDQTLGGASNTALMPVAWFKAIVTMSTWDYPYLDNPWGLVIKLFVFWPCTLGIMMGLWEMGQQVISNLIQIGKMIVNLVKPL